MVLKSKKKGQAAIEFLMTYGWMLLVVLIVGALIFSFVDFSTLLPNSIDLSNDVRGSASESVASADTDLVSIVFTYNGANRAAINLTRSEISPRGAAAGVGEVCNATSVRNLDTGADASGPADPNVHFLSGNTGIYIFNCSSINGGNGLMQNDIIQGTLSIRLQNEFTGIERTSSGPIRLRISE